MNFLHIPQIEEALDCNIYIVDMDNIPILGSKIDVWNVLMYKTDDRKKEKYWVLFYNGHYHAITNIKGFFSCKLIFVILVWNALSIRQPVIIMIVTIRI